MLKIYWIKLASGHIENLLLIVWLHKLAFGHIENLLLIDWLHKLAFGHIENLLLIDWLHKLCTAIFIDEESADTSNTCSMFLLHHSV